MGAEIPGVNHNIAGYIIMDKIKFEEFRDLIYERGIKNVMKMRAKFVQKLGFYLWEDQAPEEGRKQIMRLKENLKNEQEIKDHCEKICNQKMDFSKPLFEFYLQEDYTKTESAIILRLHHSFADAGGFVGFFSCINDEKYRMKLDKQFPKINIIVEYLCILLGPFYSIYLLFVNIMKKTDKFAKKINDLKKEDEHYSKFFMSDKRFSFEKLRK